MPFEKAEVLYAICDSCGERDSDYETTVRLVFCSAEEFDEHQQARAVDDEPEEGIFYSWSNTDGVLTCFACREKAHCKEHGHVLPVPEWTHGACMCCGKIVDLLAEGGESHPRPSGQRDPDCCKACRQAIIRVPWVDPDIIEQVHEMRPSSLGQRVALERTLQNRRDGES